jgi:hypothetical protein
MVQSVEFLEQMLIILKKYDVKNYKDAEISIEFNDTFADSSNKFETNQESVDDDTLFHSGV